MLSSLLKEHQAKQTANKETRGKFLTFYLIKPFGVSITVFTCLFLIDELRKEALVAAGNLTDALVDHLNVG